MDIKGKRILVVGLGKSGVSAARFLHRKGARVSATDILPESELADAVRALNRLPISLHLGRHPEELFEQSDLIVISPGVPVAVGPIQRAVERSIPVVSEVEMASWYLEDRIIAVTGTNGKSTTVALTEFLLLRAGIDAAACGNIGTPLVDFVPGSSSNRNLVVELSSFQLETIESFRPNIATVLNVTPDHMDRYPDFESYKRSKLRIFMNQGSEDFAVLNADDVISEEIVGITKAATFYYSPTGSLENGVCLGDGKIVLAKEGKVTPIIATKEISVVGPHNLANAMAAISISLLSGADPERLAAALRDFEPLEHRLEPVAEIDGVRFVNDSKATNVEAAAVALQSFDSGLIAIMGGRDKGGDFASLRPIAEKFVKRLLLIGEATKEIYSALSDYVPADRFSTLEEAVASGLDSAEPGDVVLLVPGCASFDMFDNFEHRGTEFKRIVKELQNAKR